MKGRRFGSLYLQTTDIRWAYYYKSMSSDLPDSLKYRFLVQNKDESSAAFIFQYCSVYHTLSRSTGLPVVTWGSSPKTFTPFGGRPNLHRPFLSSDVLSREFCPPPPPLPSPLATLLCPLTRRRSSGSDLPKPQSLSKCK